MSDLSHLYEGSNDALYRGFFQSKFRDLCLGRMGVWLGGAVQKLGLSNPVEQGVFAKLLQGKTAAGEPLLARSLPDPGRVAAWRFTLEAGDAVSALWALAPSVLRARIQIAHARAVQGAIADFESSLNGRPWINNTFARGHRSTLAATFQSGATRYQSPRLATTVFLLSLDFRNAMPTGELASEALQRGQERMRSVYANNVDSAVLRMLGHQQLIPDELARRLHGNTIPHLGSKTRHELAQPIPGRELFTVWQKQATALGWGQEKITKLFREARLERTWQNLIQDCQTAHRMWRVWVRQPHRSLTRVGQAMEKGLAKKTAQASKSQSHDHGMSH